MEICKHGHMPAYCCECENERIYFRAGQEEMRERAAKACMELDPWAEDFATAIRALAVKDKL